MKVLVTGYMGFVGKHMVKKLQALGHTIIGIDLKEGNDCRDFFRTSSEQFDMIIHLAAIVGGREKIDGNPLEVAIDLSIDAEMFNWAIRTKTKKIVYYSSSAAYPTRLQEPGNKHLLREEDIDLSNISNPDMSYGWTKLTGEFLSQFAKKLGHDVYVFRPFSGYGADQDLSYPFPSFIQRAKKYEHPFIIWGDGTQVRDFIHIDDIVDATMIAIENNIQVPTNLGTGRPTSFLELAKIVCGTMGYSPDIKLLLEKPTGVSYRCADITNMRKFFTPKISLEEGVASALTLISDFSTIP